MGWMDRDKPKGGANKTNQAPKGDKHKAKDRKGKQKGRVVGGYPTAPCRNAASKNPKVHSQHVHTINGEKHMCEGIHASNTQSAIIYGAAGKQSGACNICGMPPQSGHLPGPHNNQRRANN